MKHFITQPELIQLPHWLAMENDSGKIVGSIKENIRDKIECINPYSYIPVYHYTKYSPIKVLHFQNVVTYDEETNMINIDPFVQKIIEHTENFAMITRDERSIQIVGTLDLDNWEDMSIQSKYLNREGYLCLTKWKLNTNVDFTPLKDTIRYIRQLENNDTKPLDLTNPVDYAKMVEIYENARKSVRRLYQVG